MSRSLSMPPQRVQLDDLINHPRPGMDYPTHVQFTRDGSAITFLAPEPGGNTRSLLHMDLTSGERTLLAAAGTGRQSISHEDELSRQRRRETSFGITDYVRALKTDLIVTIHQKRLLASRQGQPAVEVTAVREPQAAYPDPTGRRVAWVTAGDLWVATLNGTTTPHRRVSSDAEPGVTNGLADYLAAEELERYEGAWWSVSGEEVLFAHIDERDIPLVSVASEGATPRAARLEVYRYPFAGGPNPRTTLRVASVDADAPAREVNLDFADGYLARVVPHPLGGWLVSALPRDQRSLHWYLVERSGAARELWIERADSWINLDLATWILSDGRVVRATESTGYRHLEVRSGDGSAVARLTGGEWVVTDLLHVDEARGQVLFTGTADGVLERHLYAVPLDASSPVERPERLTAEPGWHDVVASDDGDRWVDSWSTRKQPVQIMVRSRTGTRDVMVHSPSTTPERAGLTVPALMELPAADGSTPLNVAIFRSHRAGRISPSPTVVWIYGGPHSQHVRNSWDLTVEPYRQALVRAGFTVVVTDNRGTFWRGLQFESTNAGAFGSEAIDDQVAVLNALAASGDVNLDRVAITGTSFGGFLTILAMATRPDVFSVGVAGAPVTDWSGYDSGYTERYLGMPDENADGYRRSSLLEQVGGLRGRLLILHGTVDENVHPRHTARLVEALRAAGRDTTVVMLAAERHLLANTASRRQWLNLALDHLQEAFDRSASPNGGAGAPGSQAAS